jgi:hypothetical protein
MLAHDIQILGNSRKSESGILFFTEVIEMNLIEGYRIMFCFLDDYYCKNESDELGDLLGSMSLLTDNTPMDSAYIRDWETAVFQITVQKGIDVLSSNATYYAMLAFLRNWSELGTDGTINRLCEYLEESSPKSNEWLDAVKNIIRGDDDHYLHPIGS